MLWLPMASVLETKLAVRVLPAPLSVALPSVRVPSLNVTVPVGLLPVTVAVNVTPCPMVEGLLLLETAVVVLAFGAACSSGAHMARPASAISATATLMIVLMHFLPKGLRAARSWTRVGP